MELAGGSFIFLAFVVLLILGVAYGYYSRRGDITARQDREGNVNVGSDRSVGVADWGRGSSTSRHRRTRMTPIEARTAAALGGPSAVRARATGNVQLVAPVDPARDHTVGPADAPVTLVEYGEYECGYCKEADLVVEQVLRAHPDTVRLAFRHFPQSSIHPHAVEAAVAAEAAGRQGRFWELHAALARSKKALEPGVVRDLAARAGLDLERFEADLGDPALRARIRQDLRTGAESGVNGTPSLFVNGVRYDDEVDEAELGAAIERAAAAASRASIRST